MLNNIILYICLCFFLLLFFATFSYKLNLLDYPIKRKTHTKPTAYTGGLAISSTLLISLFLFDFGNKDLNFILSISFLVAIIGTIDDKFQLNIVSKLCLQTIPIFYLIINRNIVLVDIGDYNYFKLNLGNFSIFFTLFSVLFLINAFNYFDGADGTLSLTTISVLFLLYFLLVDENIRLFLIILLLPLCIFLCFNFSIFKLPKTFLGDGGSLLLGFIISFFLIFLANKKILEPILLAWSVVIFVYEFLSLNLIRFNNNKKIFQAGKDHLHHILIKKTKSIFLSNCLIFFSNIILFYIGYASFKLVNQLFSLILFIILFIIFFIFRSRFLIKL